jgi:type I restriction enzyme S subunit
MEVEARYEKTETGILPEDWESQTVLGVCRQIIDFRGRTPRKLGMDWGGGDIPALSASNVKKGYIDLSAECYFGSEALYKRWMTRGDVRRGDIVFTTEAPLGNVALIPDSNKYILSQRTVLLQIDPEQSSSQFLFQFLLSEQFQKVLADYSSGSTAKGIQRKKLEQLPLPKPPLVEQEAIAKVLSDVDELIAAQERLIAKKRDIKQAVMQQLLTGQTRLPGFSGAWRQIRLGETAVLKARIGWQGLTTAEYQTSGDFSLVTGTEIREGKVDWNSCFYVSRDRYDQDRNIQLHPRDVLVTKDGTIGKAAFVRELPRPATLNSGVFVIRPIRQAFDAGFFFRILRSARFFEFLNNLSAGSTINHLYQKDFVHFQFEVPPTLDEQRQIADIFDNMDEEIRILEVRLAKTRELKLGMMQQLLTGKVRLV